MVVAGPVTFEASDAQQVGGHLGEVVLVRLHDQQLGSLLYVRLFGDGQKNQILKKQTLAC